MFAFITQPNYPKAAIGLEKERVTVLSLQKEGRAAYGIRNAASVQLPGSLLQPQFLDSNVSSRQGLATVLKEAASLAGLLGQKNWSVALPSKAARTAILTLESDSGSNIDEVVDWKAEQSFGVPASALRITKNRLSPDKEGKVRYIATAVKLSVIDEYESVFEDLGWKAGLMVPRPVAESNWLSRNRNAADSLLLSSQDGGFTAVLFSNGEPNVVRSVTCSDNEKDDEIYRLLLFYNDRVGLERGSQRLDRVLAIGEDLRPSSINEIAHEALGRPISILNSTDVGLNLPDTSIGFDEIAAPAGLAVFGCN